MKKLKLPFYFDYQATTPVDRRVFDAMRPYFMHKYGNPSSLHIFGLEAKEAVEKARKQVSDVINAKPSNIIWTSGATESNNIAIKGVSNANKITDKTQILSVKTEHKCVLESIKSCKNYEHIFLDVDFEGIIDLDKLENNLKTNKVLLVSVMGVNNEIGVIQDLESIGGLCRKYGAIFHTDCAQAFGKIPLDVEKMNIDLMSISGHKIYGPKGIGALYIRDKIKIESIISGGGQEKKIRSGTLPAELIVGIGAAAKFAQRDMDKDRKHLQNLFDILYNGMMQIEKVYLNGSKKNRYPGNSNYSFAGVEGESIMIRCKEFAVSSGSACTSETLEPSYVISALNGDPDLAHSSIRIGMGRFTNEEEVKYFVKRLQEETQYLRKMSPLWDMMNKNLS
ncbi:MAG: aminotransferase class V-fold PLP-dependent enzyme [Rickettsiales bacterium]|jgi:cysteine desulfurase|nr:aminotransferase class V-fold PLP-dependent enzyme [Rickettsiales bacterium]